MSVIKLSELHVAILTCASTRKDGSVLPAPARLATQVTRIRRALPALLRSGLLEEIPTSGNTNAWRKDGTCLYALTITPAGRALISDESGTVAAKTISKAAKPRTPKTFSAVPDTSPEARSVQPAQSKIADVLAMLCREGGATSEEIIAVTGWLPHTIRAAVTRLRKKGHVITRIERDDAVAYAAASRV